MPKLEQFYVQYVSSSPVFFAGQQVDGKVFAVLSQPMKCRGVRLEIRGTAYCHWTERYTTGSGENRHTETRYYSSTQRYMCHDVLLYGNGVDTGILGAGSHEFAFSFPLPPNCATSFEGSEYGHIRYFCKAVIDKPWKFDHNVKAPFTVVRPIDLNYEPSARQPAEFMRSKTLGVCCCKAGSLTALLKMSRMGFVPGEKLGVQIHIQNESSRDVNYVSVKLEQTVTYRASRWDPDIDVGYDVTEPFSGEHIRTEEYVVAEMQCEGMGPHEDKWYDSSEMFTIPAIPPVLVDCYIIQIDYIVHVEIDPSGMSTDLDLRLPIIIGTVPLQGAFAPAPTSGPTPSAPPVDPGSGDPGAGPPKYEDLPPPSYEESSRGRTDIHDDYDNDHTRGDMNFAPRYPVYGFAPSVLPPPPQA